MTVYNATWGFTILDSVVELEALSEPEEATQGCGAIVLGIQNFVANSYKYVPVTGVFATEADIPGWQWDKRRLENFYDDTTLYLTTLGGHAVGLKDGTKEEYWQSGSILHTDFLRLSEIKYRDEFLSWTPVVRPGKYSIFFADKNLYSDYSSIEKVSALAISNGVHYHALRDDARLNSVSVVLYERDNEFINRPFTTYRYVDQFTGNLQEDLTRLPPVDSSGDVLWTNLSDRHYEYIIETTTTDGVDSHILYLNQDASVQVGDIANNFDLLCTHLGPEALRNTVGEYAGHGAADGRDCFTKYFPVENGTVRVFVIRGPNGEEFNEWTEVPNLNFSKDTDKHFSVDHDLGIITLGGYQAPDLTLREDIAMDDTEIKCFYSDMAFSSYPDQGVITIGTEKILYYSKGRSRFYNCLRGYDGTLAQSHTMGDIVSDTQHGAHSLETDAVYLSYTAMPRVEYEVTDIEERTANKTPVLDVKAITNVVTNNIIQIYPAETHVAKLVLETDSPLMGGNLYGPVYYGTDVSRLTARALDSRDNPVEGINITIVLDSPTGGLNGFLSKYTDISNSLGEIYAFYNAPYDWDSISKDVYSVVHSGDDTIFQIEELPPGLGPEDIQVYQVLKHDRNVGTQGARLTVTSTNENTQIGTQPWGSGHSVIVDEVFDDAVSQWVNGRIDIVVNGVSWTRNITDAMDIHDTSLPHNQTGSPYGRKTGTLLLLEQNIPGLASVTPGTTIRAWEKQLVPPAALPWVATHLEGVAVVLYEWLSEGVLHPIPNADGSLRTGAYYPVRPEIIETNRLTFQNRLFGLPQPHNPNSNLGGYLVVASDIVSLYAYCQDPASGRTIVSNTIRLRIDIPPYLHGVDHSGELPIPYGFGFVSEEFNVGTGIGGANFLTINPKAEGINTFNLNVNIG
jgi:hypothetical protein